MIHLLNEYNPGWKIILIGVLLEGIFPFIAIFLSSMLLDALYSGRSMQEMALLVLAGTGASFVTAILRHLVTKNEKLLCGGHAASNDRTHHDKNQCRWIMSRSGMSACVLFGHARMSTESARRMCLSVSNTA